MIAFLDTSSLIRMYYNEMDSDDIQARVSKVTAIYLSELAKLEFRSAMYKKVRTKEISLENARLVLSGFVKDCVFFKWIELDSSIIKSAADLLNKYGEHGLRTLDSIQLASAICLRGEEYIYLSSDNILCSIMRLEGLPVNENI